MWPCLRSFRVVAVSTILISFVTASLLDGDRVQHTTVEVPLASSQSQACGKPEDAASFMQAPRLPVKSLGPQSHRMDEGSSSKYALSALQQHVTVRIKTVLGVMSAHIFGLSMQSGSDLARKCDIWRFPARRVNSQKSTLRKNSCRVGHHTSRDLQLFPCFLQCHYDRGFRLHLHGLHLNHPRCKVMDLCHSSRLFLQRCGHQANCVSEYLFIN